MNTAIPNLASNHMTPAKHKIITDAHASGYRIEPKNWPRHQGSSFLR